MNIEVGMKIRSEDFEPRQGRGACFMEGIVTHTHGLIHCKTTRIVFDGQDREVAEAPEFSTAYPESMILDWDSRIQVIEE